MSESESDPEEEPESDPAEEQFEPESDKEQPESDPSEPEEESESEEEQIELESESEEESDHEEEDPDEYLVSVTPLKSNRESRGRAVSSPPPIACRYECILLIEESGGRVRRMTSRFLFAEDAIDPYNPYLCHPLDLSIIRNPILRRHVKFVKINMPTAKLF
ncbi:hypothetical protein LguiB_005719 [Lonicera macranthoides]